MIIFIDENMSPLLAEGLHILQRPLNLKSRENIEVRSLKDEFGQGAKDEDWIPKLGKMKACVITQDYNIRRTRHQRELCEEYGLGMFFVRPPSKSGLSYWETVKLLIKHWENLTDIAVRQERPFTFRITSRGKMEEI